MVCFSHDNGRQKTSKITFFCNAEVTICLSVRKKVVQVERKKSNCNFVCGLSHQANEVMETEGCTVMCPQLCVHSCVSTVMCPQLCVHSYMSTVMCPQLCVHSCVSTVMCPQLCVHSYMSTVMCPQLYVHSYVSTVICPQLGVHS